MAPKVFRLMTVDGLGRPAAASGGRRSQRGFARSAPARLLAGAQRQISRQHEIFAGFASGNVHRAGTGRVHPGGNEILRIGASLRSGRGLGTACAWLGTACAWLGTACAWLGTACAWLGLLACLGSSLLSLC
jgi:hypothetical protein